MANDRFVMVGTTDHPHEQAGLVFARSVLPNFDAWALFDLLDRSGRSYEVDLLVIGYAAIYLVELKHYGGIIDGDTRDWEWTPDGVTRPFIRPAPLSLTNQKSKVLKTKLEQIVERFPVPYVQPVIFLSNPNVEIRLRGEARRAVVGQDGFARAISHAELPDVDASRFRPISAPLRRELTKAFGKLGIKPRKGMLRAGSYVLGSVFEEGEGFQDREAYHEQLPNIVHRARVYLVPQQTTAEHRQRLTRAAEREVQLLHLARESPGVLHSTSYVADGPLGPTLLFEDFEGGISLDRFVARESPSFADRFEILKQIGLTLERCHDRNVHHGGLCPPSVLVRRRDNKLEAKLFNFQLGGSEEHSVTSHRSSLALLLNQTARLYQAPELEQNPTKTSPSTDTFSLGALAYWLFTDKPPAENPTELAQKLQRDQWLDPSAVSDSLPEALIDGIIEATRLEARISSPRDFVVILQDRLAAEQAAIGPRPESTAPVLEADKGDILIDRFEVVRVLGIGSSARVLEVKDGPETYALKVSRNAEQDDRLAREAAILRELDDPCIVRLHEELSIEDRHCLLLSLAGDRSLRQLIAEEGTLDLDLASRYGEDLLRALEALEEKSSTIHRDIKPANLGVGSRRKGLARHLTLFDFSLASAALDDLEVGTAPYRDPWLKSQGRGQWDHAADRWSAAITLHEMLTGVRPEFTPRGISPLATNAKLEIMAERFDASNRDRLIKFFEKALAREVGDRYASASLMLRSWAACFDETVRLAPVALAIEPNKEDRRGGAVHLGRATPEQIAAIRPTTEIHALPLSVRAINALDRAGLHVAEELRALPNNRVSAIRGVGTKVLGEILDVRNRWREHLGAEAEVATTSEPFYPDYRGNELELAGLSDVDPAVAGNLEDAGLRTTTALARAPKVQVEAIVTRNAGDCARLHATLLALDTRRTSDTLPATLDAWISAVFPGTDKAGKRLRMLFGLEPPYLGVAGVRLQDVADHESISRQRMHQVLAAAIDRWQLQPWRSELRSLALDIIDALGGVATLDDAIVALRPQLACEVELAPTLYDARLAALLRVAAELAPADDEPTLELRRSDRKGATILWLFVDPELWPTIQQLGRRADQLAQREPLAATGETTRILRDMVEDTPLAKLDASRLLDLAAAASRGAARSSRLELYPIGMPAERALALSAQALSTPKLTATQIHSRVRARYPEARPLPDRPALDRLLADYQFTFDETQDAYVRAQSTEVNTTSTTSFQRFETVQPPTPQPLARARDEESLTAWEFEDVLRGVRQDRKLRVLGVKSTRVPEALIGLERAFGVRAIAIDQRLITTMEHVIVAKGGKPAALPRADALGPTGPSWKLLLRTAGEAAEQLSAELLPPREPLLLVQLGLLARYGLAEFLAKLVAAANDDRSEAIVLVNAVHGDDRLDVIANTLTIPGLLAGQLTKIPREWIENRHRGSVPPA